MFLRRDSDNINRSVVYFHIRSSIVVYFVLSSCDSFRYTLTQFRRKIGFLVLRWQGTPAVLRLLNQSLLGRFIFTLTIGRYVFTKSRCFKLCNSTRRGTSRCGQVGTYLLRKSTPFFKLVKFVNNRILLKTNDTCLNLDTGYVKHKRLQFSTN